MGGVFWRWEEIAPVASGADGFGYGYGTYIYTYIHGLCVCVRVCVCACVRVCACVYVHVCYSEHCFFSGVIARLSLLQSRLQPAMLEATQLHSRHVASTWANHWN